ncbi:MAG: gamma-glutamylcyclotransferase family protein [Candidatus Baldrarchaeia archaeon]
MLVWYFAYGRNVNIYRLCERIRENPFFICRGILPGYRLTFNKFPGPASGYGYANIIPSAEEYVEGALYLLTDTALRNLDRYEGVSEHYVRKMVNVWNIDMQIWVEAETYVATKTDDSLKPYKDYLEEIIEGVKTIGLSSNWIIKLNGFK